MMMGATPNSWSASHSPQRGFEPVGGILEVENSLDEVSSF